MDKIPCSCGCNNLVESHDGKGRPGKYFSGACRVRAYRNKGVTKIQVPVTKMPLNPTIPIKPILKYPGAKWSRAKWITSYFPEHRIYLEPYCGSAAVFFNKVKSDHEVLGDADGNIINFFTVLRERSNELAMSIMLTPWEEIEYERCEKLHSGTGDALEDARRFMVWCWQAHGTQLGKAKQSWRHRGVKGNSSTTELWQQVPQRLLAAAHRLKDAEIRNRPALELISYYNTQDCLIYADPPYVLSTRKTTTHYQFEMDDDDHMALLKALSAHQGPVVLSGYKSTLYDTHLPGWEKICMPTVAEHGNVHIEVLWLNPLAVSHVQLSLFEANPIGEQYG